MIQRYAWTLELKVILCENAESDAAVKDHDTVLLLWQKELRALRVYSSNSQIFNPLTLLQARDQD